MLKEIKTYTKQKDTTTVQEQDTHHCNLVWVWKETFCLAWEQHFQEFSPLHCNRFLKHMFEESCYNKVVAPQMRMGTGYISNQQLPEPWDGQVSG